jgi:hypothetical protein
MESYLGYPDHILLTIGHLAEASEECVGASQELADEIRQHRLLLMDNKFYEVPYFILYNKVKLLIQEKGCGNCQSAKDDFQKRLKERI